MDYRVIDSGTVFIGYGVAVPGEPFATLDNPNAEVNARLATLPGTEHDDAVHFVATPDAQQFLLIRDETHDVDPGRMRSVPTYGGGPVQDWAKRLHAAAEHLGITPLTSPSWIAVHVSD